MIRYNIEKDWRGGFRIAVYRNDNRVGGASSTFLHHVKDSVGQEMLFPTIAAAETYKEQSGIEADSG